VCSSDLAEGRFKLGDERSHGFWTLGNIRDKAIIQKDLLGASIPLLKKGGVLVYSTCTLAPEENEGVVSDILATHPELVLETIDSTDIPFARKGVKSFEGISYNNEIEKTIRILPSNMTEGFYVAKIRKI
ncbi:MAG: RsmB/NOP family class I SAM-dependent RNA methyltransferase, partial [Candidatus Gracilibacteria bacterium]|nr:RsmB/NOP family class I SAM-dependent RNA methyltransferase [Candidatus Gracilibacteria bacterium]